MTGVQTCALPICFPVTILRAEQAIVIKGGTGNLTSTYLINLVNDDVNSHVWNSSYPQYGLCLKTYQSDIFNNWIQTDWIDGENGINEITAIDTSSGEFKLDALILAKKVYNMLTRIAVSGGIPRKASIIELLHVCTKPRFTDREENITMDIQRVLH